MLLQQHLIIYMQMLIVEFCVLSFNLLRAGCGFCNYKTQQTREISMVDLKYCLQSFSGDIYPVM